MLLLQKSVMWQFVRFAIAGSLTALCGMGTFYVLINFFKVWYLFASTVSFVITFIVAFCLQKFWTFNNKHIHLIPKQLKLSLFLTISIFFLNIFLMYVLVDTFQVSSFFAQLMTYAVIGLVDFFIYKHVVFKDGI